MEVRQHSTIADLIARMGEDEKKQKERNAETASNFPATAEEYMELPLEERLVVAAKMVRTYRSVFEHEDPGLHIVPAAEKSAVARVATDVPGVVVNSKVIFDHGEFTSPARRWCSRAFVVWVQAENVVEGSLSESKILGRIEFTGDLSIKGAAQELGKGWDSPRFSLDDPRAMEMIEIIDAASVNLINGDVAQHRSQVGRRALHGASQT